MGLGLCLALKMKMKAEGYLPEPPRLRACPCSPCSPLPRLPHPGVASSTSWQRSIPWLGVCREGMCGGRDRAGSTAVSRESAIGKDTQASGQERELGPPWVTLAPGLDHKPPSCHTTENTPWPGENVLLGLCTCARSCFCRLSALCINHTR